MKRTVLFLAFMVFTSAVTVKALVDCGNYFQVTHAPVLHDLNGPCQYNGIPTTDHEFTHNCNCVEGEFLVCDAPYHYNACSGCCDDQNIGACNGSPILIDVTGNGFSLTNALGGVDFDLDGDGSVERIAWTSAGSENAWLALDRNGNGVIDNGQELCGNFTAQTEPPTGEMRNGDQDFVFSSLRLWLDTNHNGTSEASELQSLSTLGLSSIEPDYKTSKRTDEHGNQFRYRAKVKDSKGANQSLGLGRLSCCSTIKEQGLRCCL